ncbi:MAG: helix-turn-helix domain-containing protein, partial [bacterium]
MPDKKLKSILTDLGLSENEAGVYLAALSQGPSTILKIAKIAGVKRTTVYPVVEALKQKGLMSEELKGWKKLYAPVSPEKLNSIIEARREKFKNALPEFMAMYNLKGNKSFIKYYEGLQAVKSVYDDLLKDLR